MTTIPPPEPADLDDKHLLAELRTAAEVCDPVPAALVDRMVAATRTRTPGKDGRDA
jgi:hypothetical protein